MARKASSHLWVQSRTFRIEVQCAVYCTNGAPYFHLVEVETEQQIAERATETLLLLHARTDLIVSEIKLLTAQLDLSEIDDDWQAYRLLRKQKLEKINELNQFEGLSTALVANPRNYSIIGLNLLPDSGEDEVLCWIGEKA